MIVAGLLATSVSEVTSKDEIRMISHTGSEPKGVNLLPIQAESLETCRKNCCIIIKCVALTECHQFLI